MFDKHLLSSEAEIANLSEIRFNKDSQASLFEYKFYEFL